MCDTALEVGEDRPTLCEGWDVKDLVVHLLLREGSPASVAAFVPGLSGVAERAAAGLKAESFADLVERLRAGPPRLSPFSLPKLDELGNTMEMFVHHEDIRRAQEHWEPRDLDEATQATVWAATRTPARLLVRKAPDGVQATNTVTGQSVRLKKGSPVVTVAGPPSEVALFVFGRSAAARVELLGDEPAVARLRDTSFGA